MPASGGNSSCSSPPRMAKRTARERSRAKRSESEPGGHLARVIASGPIASVPGEELATEPVPRLQSARRATLSPSMKESVYWSGWSTVNDSAGDVTPTHRQVVPRNSGGMLPAVGSVACAICMRSDEGPADAPHATARATTAVAASCGNALLPSIGDFRQSIAWSATPERHVSSPGPRASIGLLHGPCAGLPQGGPGLRKRPSTTRRMRRRIAAPRA